MIRDHIAADQPFSGICLGLQLLLSVSLEDGEHEGLGIIPGKVLRFDLPSEYKIPHMGWNQLEYPSASRHGLLRIVVPNRGFTLFTVITLSLRMLTWVAATTDYFQPFVSVVAKNNVMATQFHPEKSQASGMQLLKNFLSVTASTAAT